MTAMTPHAGTSLIDSPYSWFRLAISMLLSTIGSIGMWAVVVALPAVEAEFGASRGGASLAYTAVMLGFAFGNVFIGRLVDRHGIAMPAIGAALLLGGGYMLSALAADIWQFALIHGLLIGIGTSATFGPLIANVSHWFRRRRGVAVAATAAGNYLAGAIWPVFIQAGIAEHGWRATFLVMGIVCIATMVPLALLLRRPVPDEGAPSGAGANFGLKTIDMSPRMLQGLLVIAGLGCCVAMSMPQVHIVAYCADLGYGVARGAEMLSLMLMGGIVSRLLSGLIADRIGGVRTLLISSVLQCLALFLYLPFNGLASLYVVSLVFGLSQGGIVPSYAIIVREYLPAREAGQRMGLVIMATIVGMALGGWLSGVIFDYTGSYQAAFVNGIAWNLLNIAVMVLVLAKSGSGTGRVAAA